MAETQPPTSREASGSAASGPRRGSLELMCHWRLFPRSRWRLLLNIAGLLAITLVLVALILTQTPLTKRVVIPALERRTGLEIDARAVSIELNGTVVLEDVVCRVPGVAGPGGRLFWAERVLAVPGWSGIEWVHVEGATFRLSLDAETGRPNFASLPASGAGSGGPFEPPVLSLNASRFEYGEHAGGGYEVLKSLGVNGSVERREDGYAVTLMGSSVVTGERVLASAAVEDRRVRAVLDTVDLVHWPPAIAPRPVRMLASALDAEGRASDVVFTYDFSTVPGDFSIAGLLDGVAMTLPVDRDGNYRLTGERARITELSGAISLGSTDGVSATATGRVEALPYELSVESEALRFDAPFRIELMTRGFEIGDDIGLLSFAPDEVLDEFARFDRLEGIIDAAAVVERRRLGDGTLSDGEVTATLSFRDATASYRQFPYTFTDMRGTVTVSPDLVVQIVGIEGIASTGASVSASGTFRTAPSEEGPDGPLQVELDIDVAEIPIGPDEREFVVAMGGQQAVIEQLFAIDSLAADRGIDGRDPGFRLGGVGNLSITLRRKFGGPGSWNNRIVVRSTELGVVPAAFPMPLVAEDLELALLPLPGNAVRAIVEDSPVRALGGGRGRIDLDLVVTPTDDGGASVEPTVAVRVQDLAVTDDLKRAITLVGGLDDPRGQLAQLLDELGISGTVSGEVWVDRLQSGVLGVQVFAVIADAQLALTSDRGRGVTITAVDGVVEVSERTVHVDAAGLIERASGAQRVGLRDDARIEAIVTIELGVDEPFLDVQVDAESVDVSLPIAESIAVFSGEAADRVEDIFDGLDLKGVADVSTSVLRADGRPIEIRVVGDRIVELSFDAPDGTPIALGRSAGIAELRVGEMLQFYSFEADVRAGGVEFGRVILDGSLPLDGDTLGDGGALDVILIGGRFESPLTRTVLGSGGGIDPAQIAAWDAEGEFDAYANIEAVRGELSIDGWLQPLTLSLSLGGSRVSIPRMAGVVELDRDGLLRIDGLRVETDDRWSASFDGTVMSETRRLDLAIGLESDDGLTEGLRAVLPGVVRTALEQIEFVCGDRIVVDIERLSATLGGEGDVAVDMAVNGSAAFRNAAANVGIALTDATGNVGFQTTPAGRVDVSIDLQRAEAMGASIGRTTGVVSVGGGAIDATGIAGELHGGRFTVGARVRPVGVGADADGQRFDVELGLSGVTLSSLLAEQNKMQRPPAPPANPGELDAGLSLSGIIGKPDSRSGRGEIRVQNGSVVSSAFFARLISVGNFQIPATGIVNDAHASFFVSGDRVSFDRISAFVQSVELYGFGVLDLATQGLNLTFASRRVARIPVLTDVFDGIKDELVTVRVTGTLGDRQITTETLPVTRRILEQLFGASSPERSAELQDLRERAQEVRGRGVSRTPLQPVAIGDDEDEPR